MVELEDEAFIDEDKAIGIDYSLNSALCIASDMSFKNCKFHYLSSKKYIAFDNITGRIYDLALWRFTKISSWVHTSLRSYGYDLFNEKVVHLEVYLW